MGDDINAPHSYKFSLPLSASIADVFSHLAGRHYFASVAGKNHSWEAIIDGQSLALFKGNNQVSEPSEYLSSMLSQFAVNGVLRVVFQYNSATT